MATTWGSYTLAQPEQDDGLKVNAPWEGQQKRALDGTLRTQLLAAKARVTVTWRNLTAAELANIQAAVAANVAGASFTAPDGRTWTSLAPALGGLQDGGIFWAGGVTPLYTVTLELLEV